MYMLYITACQILLFWKHGYNSQQNNGSEHLFTCILQKTATVILSTQTSLHHNGTENLTLSVNSHVILNRSSVDRRLCTMGKYATFSKQCFVNLNREGIIIIIIIIILLLLLLLLLFVKLKCILLSVSFYIAVDIHLLIIYSKMWSIITHKIWLHMNGCTGRRNSPYVNTFSWEMCSSVLLNSK
jgi:hypothetical protein